MTIVEPFLFFSVPFTSVRFASIPFTSVYSKTHMENRILFFSFPFHSFLFSSVLFPSLLFSYPKLCFPCELLRMPGPEGPSGLVHFSSIPFTSVRFASFRFTSVAQTLNLPSRSLGFEHFGCFAKSINLEAIPFYLAGKRCNSPSVAHPLYNCRNSHVDVPSNFRLVR